MEEEKPMTWGDLMDDNEKRKQKEERRNT